MMEFHGTKTMSKQLTEGEATELMEIVQNATLDFCMNKGMIKIEDLECSKTLSESARKVAVRSRFQPRYA